jgi:Transposase IS116/IS110/IS902 family
VDSAQQMIAEVDAKAVTFLSAKQLSSCVGTCPGDDESAGVSKSHRSPKGNRHMRRILNQPANDAAKPEGTIFRACLSSAALAPPTQSNHRGPSHIGWSPDLDHSASRCELRRAWPHRAWTRRCAPVYWRLRQSPCCAMHAA